MITIENIVSNYQGYLINQANRLCRCSDNAKDLVQNTYIKIISALEKGQYQEVKLSKAWVNLILMNTFRDSLRTSKVKAIAKERYLKTEFTEEISADEPTYDLKIMEDLVNTLPEKSAEIIRLRCLGYKFDEIAEKINVPKASVRTHYFYNNKINKVREKLKAIL